MGPPPGPPGQMGGPGMMFEPEMIGAIKIKDGLFIGDELASTVSHSCHFDSFFFSTVGPRVRCCK